MICVCGTGVVLRGNLRLYWRHCPPRALALGPPLRPDLTMKRGDGGGAVYGARKGEGCGAGGGGAE